MNTLLTVIIPTCNRYDTLIRAVESVVTQKIINLEVIVVNDGFSELPSILNERLSKLNTVKVIMNTGPHGAANARNFGVMHATGEYITFLDDDDVYLQGRLTNVMNFIKDNNYIFVSSGRFAELYDFKSIRNIEKQRFGVVTFSDNLYSNDIDIGFTMLRQDFLNLNGFDANLASLEDWDFISRALRIKDGYKLERLDYAVNMDPNRQRVSNGDKGSYLQLASMYRVKNGEKWYAYMMSYGLTLSDSLSFILMFKFSFISMSFKPFVRYLAQHKRILVRLNKKIMSRK